MTEKKQIKPVDVREVFEKGKKNQNPIVRGITYTAEYLWDTGMILGDALANVPEQRKIK